VAVYNLFKPLPLLQKTLMEEFAFHHFGVAVKDIHEGIASFSRSFGYELRSGPFDDPIQKVSVCFLSRGDSDPTLELVAPLGPNSPVELTLRKGYGIYHVCYQVPNLRSAIDHLNEAGSFVLSGPAPAVAFGMREIAWLMTDANLLVELLQA
jgi:methylmalonyl-CoA/ethylmalonyl-CoA epimerase